MKDSAWHWLSWLGALLFSLSLGLALLLPSIWAGQVAAIGDGLAQDWPMRLMVAREWLAGHWPVWNPFHFAGAPLWAAIQPGVLFPGNLPFLCFSPGAAWHAALVLAYGAATLGAMALGRAHGLPWVACAVAGLCFGASGFMLGHVENLVMIQAAAGLPWVLAFITKLAQAKSWAERKPWVVALALAAALAVVAGHPQMAVFTALWSVFFALGHAWALPRAERAAFGASVLLGCVLGALLAAPIWLPAWLWLPHTSRAEISYQQLAFRALPLRQLLALWVPFAFGGGGAAGLAPYWGAPAFAELQGYASLGAWGLAALALAGGRRRLVWAYMGMALVALLLAMGPTTPLFQLWAAMPLLKSLPVPGRHLLAFDLGLALLAAMGVARLWQHPIGISSRAFALAGLVVLGPPLLVWLGVACFGAGLARRWGAFMPGFELGAWLVPGALAFWSALLLAALWASALMWGAWCRARGRLGGLWWGAMGLLLVLDVGVMAWGQGWALRGVPEAFVAGPWAAGPAQGRVLAVSAQRPYPFNAPQALHDLAYPGWGSLAGVPAAQGYDAFVGRRYAALAGNMVGAGDFSNLALLGDRHRLLDLAGVQAFWLETGAKPAHAHALSPSRWRQMASAPGASIWHNRRAFPRAWRVQSVAAWPATDVDFAVQGQRAWQPEALALLDAEDGPNLDGNWSLGTVQASFPVGGAFELRSEGKGPGFIVVGEAFHPGWQAHMVEASAGTASGRPLVLRRTNGWQMGVAVPEGKVRVRLHYWPPGLSLAFWLAALAVVACLSLLGPCLLRAGTRLWWAQSKGHQAS